MTMATGGIATERSPSFSLPLRFFLLGLAGFVLSTLALAGFGDELVASATSLHLGGAPAHSKYAPRRGNT